MKEPCPYCGRLYSALTRWVPGKEPGTSIKVHDIADHECATFRREPPLLPIDPDFRVIPERTDDDLEESLRRYRRAIR